jgi:carbon starvation protein CstA
MFSAMNDDNSLLDMLEDALGAFVIGMIFFGVLRLLLQLYIVFTVIFWAIITEIIWPVLRWILINTGIALLRTFNFSRRTIKRLI